MFDINEDDRAELKEQLRAQVGIGTLIVFIAMVLVAAIAAGVLINTAGFLQSKSEATGQQAGEQVTNRLQVLEVSGEKTPDDNQNANSQVIGVVHMTATKAPGAEDIPLEGLTMQWVDDTGTYDLVHENVWEDGGDQVDGAFAHQAIKDQDGSITTNSPVINNGDDRVRIVIDVGRADYDDSNTAADAYTQLTDEGDEDQNAAKLIRDEEGGIEEGETASVRITTQSGTASTIQLVMPESLSGKTAVRL